MTPPLSANAVVANSSPAGTFHNTICTITTSNTTVYKRPFLVTEASFPLYNQHQPL